MACSADTSSAFCIWNSSSTVEVDASGAGLGSVPDEGFVY
jgi:hypothetical protein